jgi:Tol biopolymer transport system component
MKVILIILLTLFLTITSIFGITIININKDASYKDEYDLAEEEKIEDSKTIAPDSEVKTIDDIEGVSIPDIDNIGAKDEESKETEEQAGLDTEDETATENQQDDEEQTEDEESDQSEETEEDSEDEEEETEEEEIIEDNTIRIFLDGDMQNGIYLGETTCGEESTEAYNLYGEEFKNTGFSFTWKNNDTAFLPGSTHYIYIYFYNAKSGWDYIREEVKLPGEKECERDIVIFIDKPQDKAITENLQQINGWTVDLRNEENPGIENIEIYLNGPKGYGSPLGAVEYGLLRYDVAEFLDNTNYLRSGFDFNELIELEPGSKHTLFIYSHSSTDNSFNYEKREIYLSGKREEKAVIKAFIDQEKLSQDNIIEITGWAVDKTLIDKYLDERRASDEDTFETAGDGYSIKKVVFTSNRDGNKNIYSINIDGTGLTRLTSYSGSDFYPEASPDGRKITYASDIGGIWQIMVMDWNGKNKKQITHNSFRCGYPSWSFDGKYIYFEAYINGDWELYRIKSDGTGQKRLTFNSSYNDWHPNGHPFKYEVIYESGVTGKENIYVMSHSGSGIRKIGGSGPRRRVPDVSNDGKKITYMRYSGSNSDIWIMDYNGQNEIKLTSNPDWDGHPSFSPDDKYIIYDEIKGSKEDLIIIDIASGAKTNITNSSSIDEDPSFLYQ